MLSVLEFVEHLEDRYDAGLYRKIKVIPGTPADISPTGKEIKKKPLGEMSNLPRETIIKNRIGHKDWNNYSIYVKHVPDLFCIDFDTKTFKSKGLDAFNYLRDYGCYHTETVKGYHFYVLIHGCPPYSQETDVANLDYFHTIKDVDLIREKKNIWEIQDRHVIGAQCMEMDWSDISYLFNHQKMGIALTQAEVAPANQLVPQEGVEEEPIVVQGEEFVIQIDTCSEVEMKSFLGRLKQERKEDSESWLKVAMGIYTNFFELDDLETGWELFDNWSQGTDNYDKVANKSRWKSFRIRPSNPVTYKTIKKYADEDSSLNIYESIYHSQGDTSMVEYINEQYLWNNQTSDIIYLDNGVHFCKKSVDIKNDLEMYSFMVEGPNGKKIHINPGKIWMSHIKRKHVSGIDFDPEEKRKDIYNLWKGFNIKNQDCRYVDTTGAVPMCQPLLDHILNVWCSGNQTHYEYVLNWFSWVLQKPAKKIGVCLCIQSRQGAGKGAVLDMVRYLMDGDRQTNYYLQTSNLNRLVGQFTTGMEGKCMINLDEAFWGGDKGIEGQLKNLITEENQIINHKHVKEYSIKNTTAFILTTNNERFAGITKDDRRYFCLGCDDSHIDTKTKQELSAYFTAIQGKKYGESMNHEMCVSFGKILYERDLSDYNPQDYPKTDLAFNQIQQNWDSVVRFWFKVLNTTVLGTDIGFGEVEDITIDCSEFSNPEIGYIDDNIPCFSKEWIFETYRLLNLGGYSQSKEHDSQFWKLSRGILKTHMNVKRKRDITRKHFVSFTSVEFLRHQFKVDQRAEHIAMFDDDFDNRL